MTALLEPLEAREVTVPDDEAPQAGRCAATGRSHRVVDAAGKPISGNLCEKHFQQLGTMLRALEREAAPFQHLERGEVLGNLNPVPSMQVTLDHGGGGLASQLSPARLDVIVHRDPRHGTGKSEDDDDVRAGGSTASALYVLHTWANEVRAGRNITRPTVTVRLGWVRSPRGPVCAHACGHESCGHWVTDTVRALPTVRGERDLLTRNLDWIARQDWAGDFYRDIHSLRDQLRRANGTAPPAPLPGRCPNVIEERKGKRVECGGPLWPVKPMHTSGAEAWTGASPSAIRCESCTRRWEGPSQVARLVLMIEQSRTKRGQR